MRLLAWGWQNPGDKLKSPSDSSWWTQRYQYPLWAPLATYVDQLERAGHEPATFDFDEALAKGDSAEISRSMPLAVQAMSTVTASPHPDYIIPAAEGQLPIPNPAPQAPAPAVAPASVPAPTPSKSGFPWWLLVIAMLVLDDGDRKRRR